MTQVMVTNCWCLNSVDVQVFLHVLADPADPWHPKGPSTSPRLQDHCISPRIPNWYLPETTWPQIQSHGPSICGPWFPWHTIWHHLAHPSCMGLSNTCWKKGHHHSHGAVLTTLCGSMDVTTCRLVPLATLTHSWRCLGMPVGPYRVLQIWAITYWHVTFCSTQAILGFQITNRSLMFHIYHALIQLLIPVYVTSFIT